MASGDSQLKKKIPQMENNYNQYYPHIIEGCDPGQRPRNFPRGRDISDMKDGWALIQWRGAGEGASGRETAWGCSTESEQGPDRMERSLHLEMKGKPGGGN